ARPQQCAQPGGWADPAVVVRGRVHTGALYARRLERPGAGPAPPVAAGHAIGRVHPGCAAGRWPATTGHAPGGRRAVGFWGVVPARTAEQPPRRGLPGRGRGLAAVAAGADAVAWALVRV